jgi:hypothetical protein
LAIHIYHDTNNELPPLATDPDHWTWHCLTMPFLESNSTYSALALDQPARANLNLPLVLRWGGSPLLCPTRRNAAKRQSGPYAGAWPTDYVAVSTSTAEAWDSDSDGMIVYRASVSPGSSPGWIRVRSATSFRSVTDGLTNTLMLGEKHMRPSWLGGQYDEPALVAFEDPNTIRVATDALGGKPLARWLEDDDPWKFGSWHNHVTHFALGDASVRPISNDTDPRTLRLLSCRNDGESVELP